MSAPRLSQKTMRMISAIVERETGIHLADDKASLVHARLAPRLQQLELPSFEAYYELIAREPPPAERQTMVDRMTTNETYFFREPEHFTYLQTRLGGDLRQRPLRIWSAASSTGEELYSTAMVVDEARGLGQVELLGSDISSKVIAQARRGVYVETRLENLGGARLRRYMMRGTANHEGYVRIVPELRASTQFFQHNLLKPLASTTRFDVIWLRNVLIYFKGESRQRIVENVVAALRPGDLLFIGCSESLHGYSLPLQQVGRSIYERVTAAKRSARPPR